MTLRSSFSLKETCCTDCLVISHVVLGKWRDVQQKAKRLRSEGKVKDVKATAFRTSASVDGDNGTYSVALYRLVPGSKKITTWDCTCPWGVWAFKRQHKYKGRTCSHALAVMYELYSSDYKSLDDEGFATEDGI